MFRPSSDASRTIRSAFRNDVFNSMPKALFFLLPVFAGILKLFYPKRRFAGHLYFALHVHAFTFAALSLSEAGEVHAFGDRLDDGRDLVLLGVAVLLALGPPPCVRRKPAGATLLKEIGIGTLYSAASIAGPHCSRDLESRAG